MTVQMDYLDTKKEKRHSIVLFTGYIGIAIAIVLTAMVLLYQAHGFGVTKSGDVTQNGLLFFSSQPNPANISIDGKQSRFTTNTRMAILSGIYKFELSREGYRSWERLIEVEGGAVQHFDYPFLVPNDLRDKKIDTYATAPAFTTQSPDRRWLVVLQPGSMTEFRVHDLKNPEKEPVLFTIPPSVLTKATSNQSYEIVSWAGNNDHILLKHNFDGRSEYILTSRTKSEESRNLNTVLGIAPTKLTLIDKKFDKFYILNNGTLQKASLSDPAPVNVKQNVLAYQGYGDDTVLYATDEDVEPGKVAVRLLVGQTLYDIRTFPAGTNYMLDLAKYSDKLYVVAAAANQHKTYIYEDPIGQIKERPKQFPAPIQVLRVTEPTHISFSDSAQFVAAQNGSYYGVYDIENERGYNYAATEPMDAPVTYATWMDGNRLTYVSGGRTLIFDYDHKNPQFLMPANSSYLPAFSPDYKFVYTFRNGAQPQLDLMQVSLRTQADQ